MKRLAILTLLTALAFGAAGCQNGRLFQGCRSNPPPECVPYCPEPVCVDDCCGGTVAPMVVTPPVSPAPVPIPATSGG
jgi:hypothetical protein